MRNKRKYRLLNFDYCKGVYFREIKKEGWHQSMPTALHNRFVDLENTIRKGVLYEIKEFLNVKETL